MTVEDDKIVGHKTMADGSHIPLTAREGREIWAQIDAARAKRLEMMPDSMKALGVLMDALTRLRDEGWSEGIYCPKDGSEFAVIQFGSTGIFSAFYSGKWPTGHVVSCDYLHAPQGLLWKATAKLSGPERQKFESCMQTDMIMHEREIRAFAAMDDQP